MCVVRKLRDVGKVSVEKRSFLYDVGLFLSEREEILNIFKSKLFPIKNLDNISTPEPALEPAPEPTPKPTVFDTPEPTKAKTKNYSLKLHENFMSKIENDENNVNN